MTNRIILFSGKAGTGKSTCANHFLQLLHFNEKVAAQTFSFAWGVKETAKHAFGWDGNKDFAGRQLLQEIGKTGRNYNVDIWVQQMYERYLLLAVGCTTYGLWGIVDDWRFPNEALYLQSKPIKITTVRIVDPVHEILKNTPYCRDVSETALDDFDAFDYIIKDAPDVEALKVEVQKIYNDLKKEI